MRRIKKKKHGFEYGIIVLFAVFFIAVRSSGDLNEEEREAVQTVKESELEDMFEKKEKQKVKVKNIRVLIMGNGYAGEIHPKVSIASKGKMCIQYGNEKEYIKSGEKIIFTPDDHRLKNGKVTVTSDKKITLLHLERGYGCPSYEGKIELWATAEGIAIINELSVESYLKAVVPSEMPSSYELEALKAQAVCARSYAYRQMEVCGYPQFNAHVNDSTDYQVYGNVEPQESTNRAIRETKGQVVYYKGKIATTYYYSTSCGKTTDMRAWGTKRNKENAYLKAADVKGKKGDYEKELSWYKWEASIPIDTLSDLIGLNTKKDIGLLKNIKVTKRGGGGVALEIKATGEKGSVVIKTENKIRASLGGDGYQIVLNDGSVRDSMDLLPSAFFTINKNEGKFEIKGGGFGHGIGMSQNGANEMAKQGEDYLEILNLFFEDIEVQ